VHGWHPSKVSKIEGGKQTPTETDIEAWAQACGQPDKIGDLTATMRMLEGQYVEFRRMFRTGQRAKQEAIAEIEEAAAFTRNFENVFVPGLLQTPEYARHRLGEGLAEIGAPPDDVDDAVAARMQRQQVLYRSDRKFHFVVTEAAVPEIQAWYGKIFGAKASVRNNAPVADVPGTQLRFNKAPQALATTKGRVLDHIGFDVVDLKAFIKKLEANGIKLDRPYTEQGPGAALAFITDPWGTYIELNQRPNPAYIN